MADHILPNIWLIICLQYFQPNILISPVLCYATESDFLNLYDTLLANYSRHMRPLKNQSAPMVASIQFDLLSVSDIDDVKQRISALAVVTVEWKDKHLIWNPDDYGGIDRMYFSEDQIWSPTVYIQESLTKGPKLFNLPTTHLVLPDGSVKFGSSGTLETSCSLDMTYFPYDYQSCKFGFGVLDSSKRDVTLVADPRGPRKSVSFVPDGEWNVHGFATALHYYTEATYEFQTFYVILKLQRRSTYYILNVMVPSVTVSILSLISFAVPVESGERLAYALTNLLSLSVYITYIGSIMPSSSVDLPIILRYLISLFLISSMCVVMTVVVIAVRWSRVIIVGVEHKAIFICGLPIKFKRKQKAIGVISRPPKRFLLKNPSVSTDTSIISSAELQSLFETPHEKCFFDRSMPEKETNMNNKKEPMPFHNVVANGNVRPTQNTEEKSCEKLKEDAAKDFSEVMPEAEVVDSEMDPDILNICSRMDLCSFCVLLFCFLMITILSFAQLQRQIPA